MNAREIAQIAVFSALGIAVRLLKHAIAGTLQFMNAPLLATIVAACIGGSTVGALTGVISFLASDAVLGLGPWTLVNSMLAFLIGLVWGRVSPNYSFVIVFTLSFLTVFAYDIISSFALYVLFIGDLRAALFYAFVGLYIPVMGGYLIGVGPLTETVTAALTALLIKKLDKLQLPLLKDER